MVRQVCRTRDGHWRVYLHDDQTAELVDERGRVVMGRTPMYRITDRLAELGYGPDDLVPD
jgi:hypothetical protein